MDKEKETSLKNNDIEEINTTAEIIAVNSEKNDENQEIQSSTTSKTNIELLEDNDDDSQLEPGEVKDDDDDIDVNISDINHKNIKSEFKFNINNFHTRYGLSSSTTSTYTTSSSTSISAIGLFNYKNNFSNTIDKFSNNDNNINVGSGNNSNIVSSGSSNHIIQPVLGKEIARKRLKALGNLKKIQMESKNYITPQNQKTIRKRLDSTNTQNLNSNNNNSNNNNNNGNKKKDKPITPHEKAKLTKQEIEQMKKREDRALPCLYYDASLIHHIRAESPKLSSSLTAATTSTKNSEINTLTSSLEAIKNYKDEDDDRYINNIDSDNNDSVNDHQNLSSITTRGILSTARKFIYNKDKSSRSSSLHYSKEQQYSEFISSKKSIHYKDQRFNTHFNYHNNKKFSNRFISSMMTSTVSGKFIKNRYKLRRNDRRFTNTNFKIIKNNRYEESSSIQPSYKINVMYTKTKPVISYAFNPNIKSDIKLPLSPLSSSNTVTNDNKKKQHNNPVSLASSSSSSSTKYQKNENLSNETVYTNAVDLQDNQKVTKDKKKTVEKNKSKRKSLSSLSLSPTKKNQKISNEQKSVAQNDMQRLSFNNDDDDNEDAMEKEDDDDDEKNKNNNIQKNDFLDDDETFFEEDIDVFPLSKDESITIGVNSTNDRIINESENDEFKKTDEKFQLPASVISPTSQSLGTKVLETSISDECTKNQEHEINKLTTISTVTDNKSPDTDDYMANWEEDEEETVNLYESITTTALSLRTEEITKNNCDDMKLSDYDTGISTCSSLLTPTLNDESNTEDDEIKDGLGTPIFVNPSPPAELISAGNIYDKEQTNEVNLDEMLILSGSNNTENSDSLFKSKMNSPFDMKVKDNICKETNVKKSTSSPLFGMQHIYEQFIQSVNEAGIDLSSDLTNSHHLPPFSSTASSSTNDIDMNYQKDDKSNVSSSVLCYNTSNVKSETISPLQSSLSRRLSTASTASTTSSQSSSDGSSTSSSSSSTSSSSSSSISSSPSSSPNSKFKLLNDNDDNYDNDDTRVRNENIEKDNDITKDKSSAVVEKSISNNREFLNLSQEDKKRIRALQKRRKMLKNLQEQSEEMDDEDKQCLLGVKKLIEAEQALLMRKFNLTTLENLLVKESSDNEEEEDDDEDDDDDNDEDENGDDNEEYDNKKLGKGDNIIKEDGKKENQQKSIGINESSDLTTNRLSDENVNNKIFDVNRETIKLKLPVKVHKTTSVKKLNKEHEKSSQSDGEDQDFTEKLMKFSSSKTGKSNISPVRDDQQSHRSKHDFQSRRRSKSRSRSCSPNKNKNDDHRTRSLSSSPVRYRRFSPSTERRRGRKAYRKQRFSPSPKRSWKSSPSDYRRSSHKKSRDKSRYSSPPGLSSRRKSRSPYGGSSRRSRTPPPRFRPPSPPTTPPQDSRESSRERSKSPKDDVILDWNSIDPISAQYYINSADSYYYLMTQSDEMMADDQYANSYDNYTSYNPYTNEYMISSDASENDYQLCYENEYISNTDLITTYSKIPVIGLNSIQTEYYYSSDSNSVSVSGENQQAQLSMVTPEISATSATFTMPSTSENCSEILNDIEVNVVNDNSTNTGTFVVQKGNVLEIVPASIIPSQNQNGDTVVEKTNNNFEDKTLEMNTKVVCVKKKLNKKKKKQKSKSNWKDEVAKRHIMSAVLKINKESDGVVKGILRKINFDISKGKQKKKVLFADGVAPGDLSSENEEKENLKTKKASRRKKKRNKKRLKKIVVIENIIDPELENAPPPPPPPGSPPPHLPQPVPIRPPSPEQLVFFHYDSVVDSMYVSLLPTPIPPRVLNKNYKFNHPPPITSLPPPSQSQSSITANPQSHQTTAMNYKNSNVRSTNNTTAVSSTILSKANSNSIDAKVTKEKLEGKGNQNVISVVNEGSNFEPNKSLISQNSQNSAGNIPIKSNQMMHITGNPRAPSPMLRMPHGNGFMNYRPPPRMVRPHFFMPPPNVQGNGLLPLPPRPYSSIRHFPPFRAVGPLTLKSSPSSANGRDFQYQQHGPIFRPNFFNQMQFGGQKRKNSPQTYDGNNFTNIPKSSSPSLMGKAIPSIVGKVVTPQPAISPSAYSNPPPPTLPMSQPRQTSVYNNPMVGTRPPLRNFVSRGFLPCPPSPLATQQFCGFNKRSPPVNFMQQQQQQRPQFQSNNTIVQRHPVPSSPTLNQGNPKKYSRTEIQASVHSNDGVTITPKTTLIYPPTTPGGANTSLQKVAVSPEQNELQKPAVPQVVVSSKSQSPLIAQQFCGFNKRSPPIHFMQQRPQFRPNNTIVQRYPGPSSPTLNQTNSKKYLRMEIQSWVHSNDGITMTPKTTLIYPPTTSEGENISSLQKVAISSEQNELIKPGVPQVVVPPKLQSPLTAQQFRGFNKRSPPIHFMQQQQQRLQFRPNNIVVQRHPGPLSPTLNQGNLKKYSRTEIHSHDGIAMTPKTTLIYPPTTPEGVNASSSSLQKVAISSDQNELQNPISINRQIQTGDIGQK